MGIRRTKLSFEGHFTQIPNAWVRDRSMSRGARGLLAEIMSHSAGWRVTNAGLRESGTEGRDALRTIVAELLEHGYIRKVRERGAGGQFGEVEYELCEPLTIDGFPVAGSPVDGSTSDGPTGDGESAHKNTISSEDQGTEESSSDASGADAPEEAKVWPVDVVKLCELLRDLVVANGNRTPAITKAWLTEADRLYRLDHVTVADAVRVLRWALADSFWSSNVLSMPTFRKQYDRLRMQEQRSAGQTASADVDPELAWLADRS